jgi:TrpR-related protein YerC/YecD
MEPIDDAWRTPGTSALVEALLQFRDSDELERFLRDLCTLGELRDLSQRWSVAQLLDQGMHYAEISRVTGASTATITRIASWVRHGQGGYALALARARSRPDHAAAGIAASSDAPPASGISAGTARPAR